MRLWTLHPRHLDPAGLVAVWREGLLAQAVLLGRTRGYTRHPQLERFRAAPDPVAAIAAYLRGIHEEAAARGYRFDASRVAKAPPPPRRIAETRGQLEYEWMHLRRKLRARNPRWLARTRGAAPEAHPLFRLTAGRVRGWERVTAPKP
ncbi:MAG: pyrimidine dimer DNA glycosylase/endonuclease V [Thermoanaerobaculia bacterium]